MQHHEHRRRQIGRQVADDLFQRLDPAGRRADDDDEAVARRGRHLSLKACLILAYG
ncbi:MULTISPECIES: hypothetical protein [unclassified Mesorhizobium]|uniref:hypothetical protein n=1 Tax=unclassified Mesorhizobium TaxID=325217 RepID=UPI001FDED505|nr:MULTISPECIES: hypothetical protein [unclassified Mesorhizobium]